MNYYINDEIDKILKECAIYNDMSKEQLIEELIMLYYWKIENN